MPIPTPIENETETQFLNRFMEDSEMIEDFPEEDQRYAVAVSTWDKYEYDVKEIKQYESIDFTPTKAMAEAAEKGLKMRSEQPPSNQCCTRVGLARANQLINRETLSPKTVKRMYSYFSRHEVDKQSDSWKRGNSKGEQAWLIWGGDPGYKWSERKVNQMKKEDEKKGAKSPEKEVKNMKLIVDIKEYNDKKGTFEGIASPYKNVDFGNDMVMPSIAKRNEGRVMPFLWQHDVKEPIGSIKLYNSDEGMKVKGELCLDKEDGQYMVPFAYKAYALMKKGLLKMSIGYNIIKESYDRDGVRMLEDIDIMEVSAVTFAMNDKAIIESVKNKSEKGEDMNKKSLFSDKLKAVNAEESLYNSLTALYNVIYDLVYSKEKLEDMSNENIKRMFESSIDDFSEQIKTDINQFIDYHYNDNGMYSDSEEKNLPKPDKTKFKKTKEESGSEPDENKDDNSSFFKGLENIASAFKKEN